MSTETSRYKYIVHKGCQLKPAVANTLSIKAVNWNQPLQMHYSLGCQNWNQPLQIHCRYGCQLKPAIANTLSMWLSTETSHCKYIVHKRCQLKPAIANTLPIRLSTETSHLWEAKLVHTFQHSIDLCCEHSRHIYVL